MKANYRFDFRFHGSHTGQAICDMFEEICDSYQILTKIDYVTTDNASNMKKAFTVCFPAIPGEEAAEDVAVADEEVWCDADTEDIEEVLSRNKAATWHSCFAHSLQLVIGDGIKLTSTVSAAIAKCSGLSTKLHSSTILKEAFERKFGSRASIPSDVCTRWNSKFRQVNSVLKLSYLPLNNVLRDHAPNLAFTVKEWSQLTELATILNPFAEATDYTQGDRIVTSSYVVPCLLGLYSHASTMVETSKYLRQFSAALRDSLLSRFKGEWIFRSFNNVHQRFEGEIVSS